MVDCQGFHIFFSFKILTVLSLSYIIWRILLIHEMQKWPPHLEANVLISVLPFQEFLQFTASPFTFFGPTFFHLFQLLRPCSVPFCSSIFNQFLSAYSFLNI